MSNIPKNLNDTVLPPDSTGEVVVPEPIEHPQVIAMNELVNEQQRAADAVAAETAETAEKAAFEAKIVLNPVSVEIPSEVAAEVPNEDLKSEDTFADTLYAAFPPTPDVAASEAVSEIPLVEVPNTPVAEVPPAISELPPETPIVEVAPVSDILETPPPAAEIPEAEIPTPDAEVPIPVIHEAAIPIPLVAVETPTTTPDAVIATDIEVPDIIPAESRKAESAIRLKWDNFRTKMFGGERRSAVKDLLGQKQAITQHKADIEVLTHQQNQEKAKFEAEKQRVIGTLGENPTSPALRKLRDQLVSQYEIREMKLESRIRKIEAVKDTHVAALALTEQQAAKFEAVVDAIDQKMAARFNGKIEHMRAGKGYAELVESKEHLTQAVDTHAKTVAEHSETIDGLEKMLALKNLISKDQKVQMKAALKEAKAALKDAQKNLATQQKVLDKANTKIRKVDGKTRKWQELKAQYTNERPVITSAPEAPVVVNEEISTTSTTTESDPLTTEEIVPILAEEIPTEIETEVVPETLHSVIIPFPGSGPSTAGPSVPGERKIIPMPTELLRELGTESFVETLPVNVEVEVWKKITTEGDRRFKLIEERLGGDGPKMAAAAYDLLQAERSEIDSLRLRISRLKEIESPRAQRVMTQFLNGQLRIQLRVVNKILWSIEKKKLVTGVDMRTANNVIRRLPEEMNEMMVVGGKPISDQDYKRIVSDRITTIQEVFRPQKDFVVAQEEKAVKERAARNAELAKAA